VAANYLNAFRAPDLAGIDRAAYSNKLLRNDVDRIPQRNAAEDVAIEADQITLNETQKQNAAGVIARNLSLAAQSPRPRDAARAFIASQEFQAGGKMIGLPVEQFIVTDQDTDESMRQQLQAWSDVLSGQGQQQRVQSTQVLEDGTIAYMTSDGQLVRTNERARNPLQAIEVAGGRAAFDPRSGQVQPITTAADETGAAVERAEALAGVVPASDRAAAAAKSPRLNAAVRRLDRVKMASQALGTGGGPAEGRLRGLVGTPAAQEMEAANAQLINEITALTRIPGVGSQSDLEQRLAQLALPQVSQHPSVRARSIQELEAFLTDLGAALDSVANPQQSGPQVGTVEDGYRYIGGDPSQQTSWQKVQ
jgi:hypothetical protein